MNDLEEEFQFEGDRGDLSLGVHMISGSFAGLMEHVALYPIDTIKTNMQVNHNVKSVTQIMKLLYAEGGMMRFWKGSGVIATGCIPAHAAYFAIYEYTKKAFGVDNHGFQFLASGLTGASSTFFHDMILTPYDVIKQRMQLSGSKKCLQCIKNVIKSEGIVALYRSLPITLFMNAPNAITTVIVNENMKKIIEPKKRKFKFLSYFYCAAFAGAVSSLITCPLDNIKTKLQTQSTMSSCEKIDTMVNKLNDSIKEKAKLTKNIDGIINEGVDSKAEVIRFKNIRETAKFIYFNEGIVHGYFRGVIPRILYNSPACAISWVSYEVMKHLFSSRM